MAPTPYTKGGVGRTPTDYLINRFPHEDEILYGIRDTFERPRNVKVSYIMINWLLNFNPKMPIFKGYQIHSLTKQYETFLANSPIIAQSKSINFVWVGMPGVREGQVEKYG